MSDLTELRQQAEELVRKKELKFPEQPPSQNELQKVIHELSVHQIELEMQQEELLQSRAKLEEHLACYTELYDFAPLGYLTLARDSTILRVNLTGTRLLGVERSLLVGDCFAKFVSPEEMPAFNTLLERAFSCRDHLSCEVMLRSDVTQGLPDDQSLSMNKGAVNNRMVRIDAVVSDDRQECRTVITDISSQKQLEQENRELQDRFMKTRKMESIGRMAGGVAHDFNNMLQIILGSIDLLSTSAGLNSDVMAIIDDLRLSVLKSAALPHQLLVFARKQTIEPKVLDFNVAVAEMHNMLKRLIGEDIDLAFVPGKDLWAVKMDPSQIDQIMTNLTLNSRDAIQGAGAIIIETRNIVVDASYSQSHPGSFPGEYVQLMVRDDGHGIDKETINSIFEPFFTTKPITESYGLGLATVYGIVSQNNGFIEVFSREGDGTTFEIYLPRCGDDVVESPKAEESGELPGGDETILLVEDDDTVRKNTAAFLKSFGYRVLAAQSPAEAFSISSGEPGDIHLLVADMIMPEMNGWDLSEELIKSRPGLRRLFISGYTADVFEHNGKQNKNIPFLGKPFSRIDLAFKVREVLGSDPARELGGEAAS